MYVFVYGTLKHNQCRSHYLQNQKLLGLARTSTGYRMHNVGDYPGLVEASPGTSIEGELWEIDEPCRARLDVVEAVAEGEYALRRIELLEPHVSVEAFAYFYLRDVRGFPDCGSCW